MPEAQLTPVGSGIGLSQPLEITVGEALVALLLLLSLATNLFLLYRRRVLASAVYTGLILALRETAWQVARCASKAAALGLRAWGAEKTVPPEIVATLREFQEFARETELALRSHHDHLATLARPLGAGDPRWTAEEEPGLTAEELERIRRALRP